MNKKIDNSYLNLKVKLRLETINLINKNCINVLELFAGDGKIWEEVKKKTTKKINILKIEIKNKKNNIYLKGDNLKFIPSLNLENFDIIDVDAYGVPYEQLKLIFNKNYKGFVHVTFIQSLYGMLPIKLLLEYGYSKEMINKNKTLLSKNGLKIIEHFLYKNGVKKITGYFVDKKNYFYFKTN